MAASTRFKWVLGVTLALTFGIKALPGNSSVNNPSPQEILATISPFIQSQGFEVAGDATFSGLPAILAHKDTCFLYIIPTPHQGWNEAIIRRGLAPGQKLEFVFEGQLATSKLIHYYATSKYYFNKFMNYAVSSAFDYPLFINLITDGDCKSYALPWGTLPRIKFTKLTS